MTALLISGCAGMRGTPLDDTYGPSQPRNRLTVEAASLPVDYWRDVKPVLDGRCVVCHACYDAPCQLKLSAFEGIGIQVREADAQPERREPLRGVLHPALRSLHGH